MTGPVARRYSDVFDALDGASVRYVVAGGVAVNFHGYPRLTVDLDLVLDLRPEIAERAISSLLELGFETRLPVDARQLADAAIRNEWVDNRNMQVFSLHDPRDPMREIDLFVKDPIPFEELVDGSVTVPVGDVSVRIASREHMIAMKRAAGRPRDLEDIAMLELEHVTTDPWDAVTFDGLRRDQERRWTQIPWPEKWEWLCDALESARDSGALAKVLARKQAAIDAAWADEPLP